MNAKPLTTKGTKVHQGLLIFLRDPSCPLWFMQCYFLESGSAGVPLPSVSV
jgi:hypothetical protein